MPYIQPYGRCVYFAQAADLDGQPIKIGYTGNINKRLACIRSAFGCRDLRLLGVIEGGRAAERRTHGRFAAACIGGELFRPDRDLLRFIEESAERPEFVAPKRGRWAKDTTPRVQLNLKVSSSLARALKLQAVEEGRHPAHVAADAFRYYLKRRARLSAWKARRRAKERPAPIAG